MPARYRLTLQETGWFTSASSAAQHIWETLAARTSVRPVANPTPPQHDIWVQDVAVKADAGAVAASELGAEVHRVYGVKMLGVVSITEADNTESSRAGVLGKALKDRPAGFFAQVTGTARAVTVMFALLIAFLVVWKARHWIAGLFGGKD